jgi:4'-phosphopantetheinyl transferase
MFGTPPPRPSLAGNQVHVWRARLDLPTAQVGELAQSLSDDEQKRAQRYRFEKHRRWFVAARGILRELLGIYLGIPSREVSLRYHNNGKPRLANEHQAEGVEFNLSHAGEVAVYAFARERAVGIDVEALSRSISFEPLARLFFSPREIETLRGLAEPMRRQAFFNCWTRKEAFIKATGEGLSRPLDGFDVSLVPGEPARLLRTAPCVHEARLWTMSALDVGPNYVGALVVRGDGWSLHCWDW